MPESIESASAGSEESSFDRLARLVDEEHTTVQGRLRATRDLNARTEQAAAEEASAAGPAQDSDVDEQELAERAVADFAASAGVAVEAPVGGAVSDAQPLAYQNQQPDVPGQHSAGRRSMGPAPTDSSAGTT